MGFDNEREEQSLIDAILANPDDDDLRLVYADWLEERGDERVEYLRTEVEYRRTPVRSGKRLLELQARFHRLRSRVDKGWIARVARVPIENCPQQAAGLLFDYECPLRWEKLTETDIPTQRHCNDCGETVYHCGTMDSALEHAQLGHCIAVDTSLTRLSPSDDLIVGLRVGRALPVPHHPDRRIHPVSEGRDASDSTTDH